MRLQVVADVAAWLRWAEENNVHDAVMRYVKSVPKIFDTSNPRSWTYVSRVLDAHEGCGCDDRQTLLAGIAGEVGDAHAKAFVQAYHGGGEAVISADQILRKYPSVKNAVAGWVKAKRTDLLASAAHGVKVALQSSDICAEIAQSKKMVRNLSAFIKDLPADIGSGVRSAAKEGGALP